MACFGSTCNSAVVLPPGVHMETAYGSGFLSGPTSCEDNPYWGLRDLLEFLIADAELSCRCPQGKCNIITLTNCWDIIIELNEHAANNFASYVPPSGPSSFPVTSDPSTSPSTSSPSTNEPTFRPSQVPSNSPTSSHPSFHPSYSRPTLQPTSAEPSEIPSPRPTSSNPTDIPTTDSPSYVPTASTPTRLPTTDSPTRLPTRFPTTQNPTRLPTESPITLDPTHFPTTTRPTRIPSRGPTSEEPTNRPTESEQPTYVPTNLPTNIPTTARPTNVPSNFPTTARPTSRPSRGPSTTLAPTRFPNTPTPSSSPVVITGTCEHPKWSVIAESDCPPLETRIAMLNCQEPGNMALGELCEADGPIPGFPQANTVNNCGNEDVFRLTSCDEENDSSGLLCVDDNAGLYIASYGLLDQCESALNCDTILNTVLGTTIADFCGQTCKNCDCPSGSVFVNADIIFPDIENGKVVTLMCPPGFLGNVQIKCDFASVEVHYGTCVMDLWTRSNPALEEANISPVIDTKVPTGRPTKAIISQIVDLEKPEDSKEGIHPVFLYIACVTSGLLVILCLINCVILLRNNRYSFANKAEDEKRPAIISIAPEYIHQHGFGEEIPPEGEPELLDTDELPSDDFDELGPPSIEPESPPPVAAEISIPAAALKGPNLSRSASISNPWWAKSRSRPRHCSQFSLASSLKSDPSHKRLASGQISEVSSSIHSRSRIRHRSSGLYLHEPRVHFLPTPSPQPSVRDNCVFLPPLKEDDEDPSELSSEDLFEEKGLYVSSIRSSVQKQTSGFTPSQSLEGHPTPSHSMLGHRSTSFSEEGSTTATSYFVGSSPSVSLPRKLQHKTFEKPRRVVSRAVSRRMNMPNFFVRSSRVSV